MSTKTRLYEDLVTRLMNLKDRVMDYEQKYKWAVKKIQELFEKGKKDHLTITAYEKDFEEIFPELVESEDERIRKALITYFSDEDESYDGIPYPNIRAWLEKVGSIIKEWGDLKFQHIQNDLQEMVDLKQKTEQGEQKPGWSEEDEKIIKQTIGDIEQLQRYCKYDLGKSLYIEEINWLKSLKDRVQPMQEWNEEDQHLRNVCINACRYLAENFENSTEHYQKCIDWLKSLRPQIRWKPSDELLDVFIKNATDFFESNFNPLTDGGVIGAFDDKNKMIEEFKEYMKEEGFNEEWI